MRLSFLLLALLFATALSAQLSQRYRAYVGADERIIDGNYQVVFTRQADNTYRLRRFYPERYQLIEDLQYKDKKRRTKEGPYASYSDHGVKTVEGQFIDNKKEGTWRRYHRQEGHLVSMGDYVDGRKAGEWEDFHPDGQVSFRYRYDAAERYSGPFTRYDSLGQVTSTGVYEAGEIVAVTYRDTINTPRETWKVVERMPRFTGCAEVEDAKAAKLCSENRLFDFLRSELRYPKRARRREIQGNVVIGFVVERDGQLSEIEALKGVSADLEAEALRVVRAMPAWQPGSVNGEAVRVQYNLPIRFKLE